MAAAEGAPEDEDDYQARSRRRKEQLKREDPLERVPYIHGPQEDANPIIDYVIKSHKYKNGKPKGGARPDNDSLAQVPPPRCCCCCCSCRIHPPAILPSHFASHGTGDPRYARVQPLCR